MGNVSRGLEGCAAFVQLGERGSRNRLGKKPLFSKAEKATYRTGLLLIHIPSSGAKKSKFLSEKRCLVPSNLFLL